LVALFNVGHDLINFFTQEREDVIGRRDSVPASNGFRPSGDETNAANRLHDAQGGKVMWLITPKVRLCVPYLAFPVVNPLADRACRSTGITIVLDGPSSELVENQLHR
jgi:hypothetical protein